MPQPRSGVTTTLRTRDGTALRLRGEAFTTVSLPFGPTDRDPEATAG